MMNRRQFLGNLFKTAVVAAVAPSVIAQIEAIKPQLLTFEVAGKTYWFDHAMWLAEKKWMEEQEQIYFGTGFYGKRFNN